MAGLDFDAIAARAAANRPTAGLDFNAIAARAAAQRAVSPEEAATRHDAAYSRPVMGPNAGTPSMSGTARTDNPMQLAADYGSLFGMSATDVGRAQAEARQTGGRVFPYPTPETATTAISAMRDRVGRAGDMPIQEAVRLPEGMVNTAAGPVDAVALARQLRENNPHLAASVASLQGIPFVGSWSDELLGQVIGAIGTNDPGVVTEVIRQIDRTYSEDMPVTSGLIKLASGLGTGAAMVRGAAPAVAAIAPSSPIGRAAYGAGAGALAGAAEGAVYGAGEGEAGTRMDTAGQGAAVGGVVGGALGGLVPMAASGLRALRDLVWGTPVRDAARALGVSTDVIENLRRTIAADEAAGGARLQPGGMLADAGPAAAGSLDTAVSGSAMGSPLALARVSERATREGAAVISVMDDVLGTPQGVRATVSSIRGENADEVARAYDAARAAVVDVATPEGQAVVDVLNRMPQATLERAVRDANEMLRWDGVNVAPLSITRNAAGQIEIAGDLGVAHLDYIKRALDEVRRDGVDPLTGRVTSEARRAGDMARQVRDAAQAASPEYATALSLAAPQQARMAAVETGNMMMRDAVTMDQAREMLSGMNAADRAAAAQGVRDYIDHQLSRVRATAGEPNVDVRQVARAVTELSSDLTRGKLTLLVGAQDAERIMSALDRAGVVINLRAQTATNSRSAGRESAREAGKGSVQDGIFNSIQDGRLRDAAQEIVATANGRSAAARRDREAGFFAELADILTRSDSDEAIRALNLLRNVNAMEPITRERATYIANQVVAVVAAEVTRQAGQRAE